MERDSFFGIALWQQLVAVAAGIPAGFFVTYWGNLFWHTVFVSKEQSKSRRAEIGRMLQSQFSAIERNLWLLTRIKEELDENRTPTFNVDLSVLDATAAAKYEVLDNWDCCQAVDLARFELSHLARKVDQLFAIYFHPQSRMMVSGGGKMTTFFNEHKPQLVSSIRQHMEGIEGNLNVAANELTKLAVGKGVALESKPSQTHGG